MKVPMLTASQSLLKSTTPHYPLSHAESGKVLESHMRSLSEAGHITLSSTNVTIKMGMRTRLQSSNKTITIGPIFRVHNKNYFFSVGHGFDQPGSNHIVEASIDGFNWTTVGTRVIWDYNQNADFALIELNTNVVVNNNGNNLRDMSILVQDSSNATSQKVDSINRTTSSASGLRECGIVVNRSDLDGAVEDSPVVKDQFLVRCTQAPYADAGDSGMGIWLGDQILGIEWAIYNLDISTRFCYVTPICTYISNLVSALNGYVDSYKNSSSPPLRYQLVKNTLDDFNSNNLFFYKKG